MKISNKRDYSDRCSVIISLTQKVRKIENQPTCIWSILLQVKKRKEDKSIGFRVYNVKPELANKPTLSPDYVNNALNMHEKSGAFINYREVCIIYFM